MQALFISRDGVINTRVEGGVTQREQVELIAGSIDSIAKLSKKGFTIIMLTHQPGLSQGLLDLDEMEAIHAKIIDGVENRGGEITGIFYCPHDEADHCYCRPPATGLLDVIEIELDCELKAAYYFCDNEDEASAAREKGCEVIFCDAENTLETRLQRLKM
jgi:D-glycero-D-manno-heptose 1,7-bisphosphate phosphatase